MGARAVAAAQTLAMPGALGPSASPATPEPSCSRAGLWGCCRPPTARCGAKLYQLRQHGPRSACSSQVLIILPLTSRWPEPRAQA